MSELELETVATLTAKLTEIEAIIASGATSVAYESKSTNFRSLSDLIRIRADYENRLALLLGGRPPKKQVFVKSRKGL